jgi:peptidyl-prolyl cis-trans isomerase A (cyclophilin A)
MKAWIAVLVLVGAGGQQAAPPSVAPAGNGVPVWFRLETTAGTIGIEVWGNRAPVTAANFLRYVERGDYDGGRFHRTVRAGNQPDNKVRIDVIQAGRDPASRHPELPPIPLERTNATGLSHVDGALSMARDGPDTATSDFFICVGDQPELDFGGKRNPDGHGFAVFGRVVKGMDVVRRIHAAPADGQSLTPPVIIRKVGPVPPLTE